MSIAMESTQAALENAGSFKEPDSREKKRKRQAGEDLHTSKSKKYRSDLDPGSQQSFPAGKHRDLAEQNASLTAAKSRKQKSSSSSRAHRPKQSSPIVYASKSSPRAAPAGRAVRERNIPSSTANKSIISAQSLIGPLPPSSSSPFHIQTSSLQLPLAPISQSFPLEGLCAEHISPLILTYYPPFDGVLLSYSNPRISEKSFGNDNESTLGKCVDEYAVTWSWLTAEFLIFKPNNGQWLEGYINLQNEGHIGLVCWNLFNASIERRRLPEDWSWRSAEEATELGEDSEDQTGYFVDNDGEKIEGMLKFRVREMESTQDRDRSFLGIEGTMLDDKDEELIQEKERNREIETWRSNNSKALGSTSLGLGVQDEQNVPGEQRRRY